MTLRLVDKARPPDPYAPLREAMAKALDELFRCLTTCRQVMMERLDPESRAACQAEFSLIFQASRFAKDMARTLREMHGPDDPYALFNALEHASTSIVNCVMILRSIEPSA